MILLKRNHFSDPNSSVVSHFTQRLSRPSLDLPLILKALEDPALWISRGLISHCSLPHPVGCGHTLTSLLPLPCLPPQGLCTDFPPGLEGSSPEISIRPCSHASFSSLFKYHDIREVFLIHSVFRAILVPSPEALSSFNYFSLTNFVLNGLTPVADLTFCLFSCSIGKLPWGQEGFSPEFFTAVTPALEQALPYSMSSINMC